MFCLEDLHDMSVSHRGDKYVEVVVHALVVNMAMMVLDLEFSVLVNSKIFVNVTLTSLKVFF